MKTTVSERGQITIPKNIRSQLGLTPGTVIDFEIKNGSIVGRKKEPEVAPLKWLGRGELPQGFVDADAYLKSARE